MADYKALVLVNGLQRQIADADTLLTGSGIKGNSASNPLSISSAQGTVQVATGNAFTVVAGASTFGGTGSFSDTLSLTKATGTGLNVTAGATVGNALTVSAGGAAVTGNSSITGTLGVSNTLTVSAGGAAVTGNSTVTGTLGVSDTLSLTKATGTGLSVTAGATIGNALTVSAGGAAITGASTVTGTLGVSDTLSLTKATGTGLSVTAGATIGNSLTVTTGGLTVSAGGAAVTGNSTVTGTLGVSSTLTVSAGGAVITGASTVTGTLGVSDTLSLTKATGNGLSVTADASIGGAATVGTGLTVTSGGATITAGGLTVSAGGAAITGNSTVTGTLGVSDTLTASKATGTGLSVTADASVGGTLALTKATGTGLAVTADMTVGGSLTVTGATYAHGGVERSGAAAGLSIGTTASTNAITMGSNAACTAITIGNQATTINLGGTAGTAADVVIWGDLEVKGAETVVGTTTFNDAITLGDAAADTITVNGTMTITNQTTNTFTCNPAAVFNGAVTLGNAAADAITVEGTMGFGTTGVLNIRSATGAWQIGGSNIATTVTAAALNVVCGNGTQNADSYHIHAASAATEAPSVVMTGFTVKSGDSLVATQPCYISASNELAQADADAAPLVDGTKQVVGIYNGTGKLAVGGNAVAKMKSGYTLADWYGKALFVDTTAGQLSPEAPASGLIQQIGILAADSDYAGTGAVKIALDIKTPIVL